MNRWMQVGIWLFYSALIVAMSSLPSSQIDRFYFFPGQDKLIHFFEYLLLAFLTDLVFIRFWPDKNKTRVFSVLLYGILFAVADEFHQAFVPGRSCSGWDLLTDLLAFFCYYPFLRAIPNHFRTLLPACIWTQA